LALALSPGLFASQGIRAAPYRFPICAVGRVWHPVLETSGSNPHADGYSVQTDFRKTAASVLERGEACQQDGAALRRWRMARNLPTGILRRPGVFLRLGQQSAVRMLDSRLDTVLDVEKGRALVEVVELVKGGRIQMQCGGTRIELKRKLPELRHRCRP
jgi:hypothetical protein